MRPNAEEEVVTCEIKGVEDRGELQAAPVGIFEDL